MSTVPRRLTAATALLALALAGCTAVTPEASPSTTPAARPTATAAAPHLPTPRVELDCDELTDAAALATTYGIEGGLRTPPPPTGSIADVFAGRAELAVRQQGALLCEWGLADGPDPALVVQVLPAVADLTSLGGAVEPSTIADGARERCGERTLRLDCAFWMPLTATTTVVALTGAADLADDLDAFRDLARVTAGDIARAADAASIAAAWEPPASSLAIPTACAGLIADGSRLGSLGALTADAAASPLVDPLALAALAASGSLSCSWTGADGGTLDVLVLADAAWAWDEWPPRTTDDLDFTPRDGLGEAAAIASVGGEHLLDVRAGGTWLSIRADTSSPEAVVDLARAILGVVGWAE